MTKYLWFVLTHRSTLYVSWLCPNLNSLEHRSIVYSWWLCQFTVTWIHSVYLVAMIHLIFCNMSMGMPTSENSILLCWCLIVCRFPISAILVSDTHILQSISTVTSSGLILWGEFCYTLFWSPHWSIDDMCPCSHEKIKRVFLHEESDWLSLLKNPIKEGFRTLQNAWGATMPDRLRLL